MPKFKNVSEHRLEVHVPSGIKMVDPGGVLDVSADEAPGFAVQVGSPGSKWEHADSWRPDPEPEPSPEPPESEQVDAEDAVNQGA